MDKSSFTEGRLDQTSFNFSSFALASFQQHSFTDSFERKLPTQTSTTELCSFRRQTSPFELQSFPLRTRLRRSLSFWTLVLDYSVQRGSAKRSFSNLETSAWALAQASESLCKREACVCLAVLVIIFLENSRDLSEIITSTGAKFSCNFCPSALVLVIFLVPIFTA